ncbi:MAG: hypothetical protein ACTSR8_21710 [Promethearchaeota archaeon]
MSEESGDIPTLVKATPNFESSEQILISHAQAKLSPTPKQDPFIAAIDQGIYKDCNEYLYFKYHGNPRTLNILLQR